MQDTQQEARQLKSLCKDFLQNVEEKDLIQFSKIIFPVQTTPIALDLFYYNLYTFYSIRINKNLQFDEVTKELFAKAKQYNEVLFNSLESLFKSLEFRTKLKKITVKKTGPNRLSDRNKLFEENSKSSLMNEDSNNSTTSVSYEPRPKVRRQPLKLASNSAANQSSNENPLIINLSDQDMCFCGKHVSLIEISKESFFECFHCKKKYHVDCMKRPLDANACCYCYLKKMIPNRIIKRTIFVGLLKKGKRKHEIMFNLNEEDRSILYKIQCRCIRIKQNIQSSILFPDSVYFMTKNTLVQEFNPLHKQSSLKNRKDEPFYLTFGLNNGENRLSITERHPDKQKKNDRIELENHLFGIYVIEEKKVDWLVRQMKASSHSSFNESKNLLEAAFQIECSGDEIVCEVIKIPLTCNFTANRINIPARGIFCTHFQCFDLKNFLQLTASTSFPRWMCPICKLPAYQFRIDGILSEILSLHKGQEVTEVLFQRSGQFRVFQAENECKSEKTNIYDFEIAQKLKRELSQKSSFISLKKKIFTSA